MVGLGSLVSQLHRRHIMCPPQVVKSSTPSKNKMVIPNAVNINNWHDIFEYHFHPNHPKMEKNLLLLVFEIHFCITIFGLSRNLGYIQIFFGLQFGWRPCFLKLDFPFLQSLGESLHCMLLLD